MKISFSKISLKLIKAKKVSKPFETFFLNCKYKHFNYENKGNAVWKNKRQWERDMKHFKSMMDTSSNAKAAALNNGKN